MRSTTTLTFFLLAVISRIALAQPQWPGQYGNHHRHQHQQPQPTPSQQNGNPGGGNGGGGGGGGGGGNGPGATQTGSSPPTDTSTSSSNTTSSGGSKKGALYLAPNQNQEVVSLAPPWACNWDTTPGVDLPQGTEYVPQLWGIGHTLQPQSSDYVLYYNEPDECAQGAGGSCIGVQDAINNFAGFKSSAGGKKVSSPCVRNSSPDYLRTFLQAQKPDVLCWHWYGDTTDELTTDLGTFKNMQGEFGISEIWLSEWGVNSHPSDISDFESVLEGQVNRYAYNLANLGAGGTI